MPILRKEDPALLSGRGRYADDLPVPAGTLARSRHPLAASARRHRRASMPTEALAQDGVWAVITGEDVQASCPTRSWSR